jgi:hypothetical protein
MRLADMLAMITEHTGTLVRNQGQFLTPGAPPFQDEFFSHALGELLILN